MACSYYNIDSKLLHFSGVVESTLMDDAVGQRSGAIYIVLPTLFFNFHSWRLENFIKGELIGIPA